MRFTHGNHQNTQHALKGALLESAGLYSEAAAADDGTEGDACILPPSAIEGQAKAVAGMRAKIVQDYDRGQISDLHGTNPRDLRTLARAKGIKTVRTRSELVRQLDLAEPEAGHAGLGATALFDAIRRLGLSVWRSADELALLLLTRREMLAH